MARTKQTAGLYARAAAAKKPAVEPLARFVCTDLELPEIGTAEVDIEDIAGGMTDYGELMDVMLGRNPEAMDIKEPDPSTGSNPPTIKEVIAWMKDPVRYNSVGNAERERIDEAIKELQDLTFGCIVNTMDYRGCGTFLVSVRPHDDEKVLIKSYTEFGYGTPFDFAGYPFDDPLTAMFVDPCRMFSNGAMTQRIQEMIANKPPDTTENFPYDCVFVDDDCLGEQWIPKTELELEEVSDYLRFANWYDYRLNQQWGEIRGTLLAVLVDASAGSSSSGSSGNGSSSSVTIAAPASVMLEKGSGMAYQYVEVRLAADSVTKQSGGSKVAPSTFKRKFDSAAAAAVTFDFLVQECKDQGFALSTPDASSSTPSSTVAISTSYLNKDVVSVILEYIPRKVCY